MKIFPRIVQTTLFITTSVLSAYPINEFPDFFIHQASHQPIQIPDLHTLSYDEVIELLDKVESDSFDERYSTEDLARINQFISFLAMEGTTEDEKFEMQYAIGSLFQKDPYKHVKMVRDYLDKSVKEIQKGINSYEKQIAIHRDKIANPIKYYSDWDKLDSRQCEALLNKKWPAEIRIYEEQKNVLQSILNERLSYE